MKIIIAYLLLVTTVLCSCGVSEKRHPSSINEIQNIPIEEISEASPTATNSATSAQISDEIPIDIVAEEVPQASPSGLSNKALEQSSDIAPKDAAYNIFSNHPNNEIHIGYWNIPDYDYGAYPSEGLFWVCKDRKFGFLNSNDLSIAIPLEYEACGDFFQGVAAVKKNGKWGLIDKNNSIILPFKYDNIANGYSGFVIAYPFYRTIWKNPQFSMIPDFEILSYQIYDITTWSQMYSLDTPIYIDTESEFSYSFFEWINDNQYPAIDLLEVDTTSIDINGLWTYIGTSGVMYENEPVYEVIVWDDSIPYSLVNLS
jgi:hypothetical protein